MTVFQFLIIAASSYLLGSLSFAIIVSKITLGKDIRNYGSGNAGLTNAFRIMGGGKTLLVLLGDVLKGVAALVIGDGMGGVMGKLISGIFVILGHVFPVYFGFRGGKGVLVGATFLFLFDWRCFLIGFAVFLPIVILTRYVSLGSVLGAATFPVSMYLFYQDVKLTIVAFFMAGAVIFMHRSNIRRLLAGTESRFTFHNKPKLGKPAEDDKGEDA